MVDEVVAPPAQLVEALEAGAAQRATREDGEPLFDRVKAACVTQREVEADAAGGVFQPRAAFVARVEGFLIGAWLAAEVGDAVHNVDRHVRVELIEHHGDSLVTLQT